MVNKTEYGSTSQSALIAVLAATLLGSLAVGYWAYSGRQDYKNNVDKKVATAVTTSNQQLQKNLQIQFDQQSKQPYKTYNGPATYGSVSFAYPKTWSAYVDDTNQSSPINAYFHPNVVPAVSGSMPFALRLEILNQDYMSVLQQFSSGVQAGSLTAIAYIPPKMQKKANIQPGTKLDGQIDDKFRGSMVILKVRDKTLKIYTLSNDYLADFNSPILASLSYEP